MLNGVNVAHMGLEPIPSVLETAMLTVTRQKAV